MSRIVRYEVGESTWAEFEIGPESESGGDWGEAGAGELAKDLAVQVRDAVGPAAEAAKAVLGRFKESGPDAVEVKFGVRVTGEANWIVAKAATAGTFEVTLTWKPGDHRTVPADPAVE